jgi:hypothetical protein
VDTILGASITAIVGIIAVLITERRGQRRQAAQAVAAAVAERREAYVGFEAATGEALAQLNFAGAYRVARFIPWAVSTDVVTRLTAATSSLTRARCRIALVGAPDDVVDAADHLLDVLADVGGRLAWTRAAEHESLLLRYRDARVEFERAARADAAMNCDLPIAA